MEPIFPPLVPYWVYSYAQTRRSISAEESCLRFMADTPKPALAAAFDLAWGRFLEIVGEHANTPENLGKLAARIVVLSRLGVMDENQLSDASLTYLRAAHALDEMSRSQATVVAFPSRTREAEIQGEVFDPETVSAMGEALQSSLDELPLQLPQSALSVLVTSIMAQAAQGIKDPTVLRSSALRALESRK